MTLTFAEIVFCFVCQKIDKRKRKKARRDSSDLASEEKEMSCDSELLPEVKVEIDVAAYESLPMEAHDTPAGKICCDEAGVIPEA